MTTPIIGITPSAGNNNAGVRTYKVAADYSQAVERSGGIPVILPLHIKNVDGLLDKLDGIVFSGGGDIDATLFNQENHETVSGLDEERDSFEIALMQAAFDRDMPILAICRGAQVMNVARGGDLIQDIPSQTDSKREHAQRAEGAGEHDLFQIATVAGGDNPITAALGEGSANINSFHHQSVGKVAPDLEVVATADDGIIEAMYAPKQTYAVGTQWHPERLATKHAEHQALFGQLIDSAKNYAIKK